MYFFASSISCLIIQHAGIVHGATSDAPPPLQTIELRYLNIDPASRAKSPFPDPSAFSPLATLTYSPRAPHNARLQSLTPPPNNTEHTSVALFDPKNPKLYRSTTAATQGFHKPYSGRFRILLSADGTQVISANHYAYLATDAATEKSEGNGKKKHNDEGDFDVVLAAKAPKILIEKPAKKVQKSIGISLPSDEAEEGEKVEEKTFFQKYWWLLVAALVISLVGPGADK